MLSKAKKRRILTEIDRHANMFGQIGEGDIAEIAIQFKADLREVYDAMEEEHERRKPKAKPISTVSVIDPDTKETVKLIVKKNYRTGEIWAEK